MLPSLPGDEPYSLSYTHLVNQILFIRLAALTMSTSLVLPWLHFLPSAHAFNISAGYALSLHYLTRPQNLPVYDNLHTKSKAPIPKPSCPRRPSCPLSCHPGA